MLEYLLWRKYDDLGWAISKSAFNLDAFDEQDRWYFNHLLTEGTELLRVGASIYELNQRHPSTINRVVS